MKYLLPLMIAFFSGCCTGYFEAETMTPTMVRKIDAEEISRTIIRFSTYLKRELGLSLEDSSCFYSDCAERIRIVYSSQKIIEICEARAQLVEIVEGLLSELNSNSIIRADLCNGYFTADNLEIYINYESYFCEYVDPFYVGWVTLDDGLASYYMATQKQWYYDTWHSRIEPYYKSLEFVEAQKEADLIYPPELPPHIRARSIGPEKIDLGLPRAQSSYPHEPIHLSHPSSTSSTSKTTTPAIK